MMEVKEENGNMVCVFSGRLDTLACLQLEKDVLAQVHAAQGSISFDLEGVDFVASMFLRLCIQTCKEMETSRFRIVNTCPNVRKVFNLAGLDTLMPIE